MAFVLQLLGLLLVVAGFVLWWLPAGLMVAGVAAFAVGTLSDWVDR